VATLAHFMSAFSDEGEGKPNQEVVEEFQDITQNGGDNDAVLIPRELFFPIKVVVRNNFVRRSQHKEKTASSV
jgi:hypothetical protein